MVKLKILAAGLDHMLTLTYRENFGLLDVAKVHLERFVRIVKRRFPDWRYVGCWETQKRGAIHWHLAVRGFQDVRFLRAAWLRVIAGGVSGAGNIDVTGPESHWSPYSIATYITKYITKENSVGRALNDPRYVCSKGIKVPMEKMDLPQEFPAETVHRIVEGLVVSRVGDVAFQAVSEDGSFGFVCGIEEFSGEVNEGIESMTDEELQAAVEWAEREHFKQQRGE
jgi:hypothetical protein